MDTEQKLLEILKTFERVQANSCGNLPISAWPRRNNSPIHLHYELNQIKNCLDKAEPLTAKQIEFVDKVYSAEPKWLDKHVYILSNWYEYSSKHLKHHKLTRRKAL